MTLFKGRNEGRVVGKNSPFLGRAWLLLPSVSSFAHEHVHLHPDPPHLTEVG